MGEVVEIRALEDHDGTQQKGLGKVSKTANRNPVKYGARQAVGAAVRAGLLVRPAECSRCGSATKIEGHHHSYALEDWFKVEWLCRACHLFEHFSGRSNANMRILAIRFTEDEYKLIADKASSSGVKPSTLARIVLVQVLKAGIEVN